MSVTNAESTNDTKGEHKFKVASFLVTNLHNSSVSWFSHIDELAEKAVATNIYKIGHLKRLAAKQKAEKEAAASSSQGSGNNVTAAGTNTSTPLINTATPQLAMASPEHAIERTADKPQQ